MVGDLTDVLNSTRPTHIFTTSQWDTHTDHSTTYTLVVEAALNAIAANPGYNPTLHKTTVWPGGESGWPGPSDPLNYFAEMSRAFVSDPTQMVWSERESLDVPSSSQSPLAPGNPKYTAIASHESQGGSDRYISLWVHKDEVLLDRAAHWRQPAAGAERWTRAGGAEGVGLRWMGARAGIPTATRRLSMAPGAWAGGHSVEPDGVAPDVLGADRSPGTPCSNSSWWSVTGPDVGG